MPKRKRSNTNTKYFQDIPIFKNVNDVELNNMLSVIDKMHEAEKEREETNKVMKKLIQQKKKQAQSLTDKIKYKKTWLYKFKDEKKR